jgi:predicted RNase H-like HicB family nuclease
MFKTKYGSFYAKVWHEKKDNMYLAELPAFDNVMTQGSSKSDIQYMVKDLIQIMVTGALADGKLVIDDERRIFAI